MSLNDFLTGLQTLPLATAMAESDWLFPTVESLHVIAITLVVASIVVVDLRLIRLSSTSPPLDALSRQFLPITWAAFAAAALTGALLFLAKPNSYVGNAFFLSKLGLIGAAGINMVAFHLFIERRTSAGGAAHASRAFGAISLSIWLSVVAVGRWIGFTI